MTAYYLRKLLILRASILYQAVQLMPEHGMKDTCYPQKSSENNLISISDRSNKIIFPNSFKNNIVIQDILLITDTFFLYMVNSGIPADGSKLDDPCFALL